jgi:hypothetical protein
VQEPPKPPSPPHTSNPLRTGLLIGGLAAGGAGIAVGAVTGLISLSHANSAKATCRGFACPPSSASMLSSAKTNATVSTVAFVAGGVGLGAAAVAFFVLPSAREAPVTAWISPGEVGVAGRF